VDAKGKISATRIHHASLSAPAVGALVIAMIETPKLTLLMTRPRSSDDPRAAQVAAGDPAVDAPAIAAPADVEDPPALAASKLSKRIHAWAPAPSAPKLDALSLRQDVPTRRAPSRGPLIHCVG
jgi:hypothetical protein